MQGFGVELLSNKTRVAGLLHPNAMVSQKILINDWQEQYLFFQNSYNGDSVHDSINPRFEHGLPRILPANLVSLQRN